MKKFLFALAFALMPLAAFAQTVPAIELPNVAALRAGAFGSPLHLQGNTQPGDSGEGYFIRLFSTCVDDGVTHIKDRAGSCFVRQNLPANVLIPQMFGAKCDATNAKTGTDDFVALKAMMIAAHSIGAEVQFPAGTACLIKTGANLDSLPVYSGMTIGGSGTIYFDDAGLNIGAFAGTGISDVTFKDFHCVGTWDTRHVQNAGSCVDAIASKITFTGISCLNIARWCVNCPGCYNLTAANNFTDSTGAGGFVCFGCFGWNIHDNRFYHSADNAIAMSQEPGQAEPVGGVGTIHDNIMYDTFGIESLGSKVSTISNNVGFRVKGFGIMVDYAGSFQEGETSSHTLTITNNVFSDMVSVDPSGTAQVAGCLKVGSFGQAGSHILPWSNSAGVVQTPWPYAWTNGQLSANTTVEPGHGAIIANNTCGRSLPGTGTYSSAGFNPTGTTDGAKLFTAAGYIDPSLTDGFYQANGLETGEYLTNALISNNYFQPGITCWLVRPAADLSYRDVRFENNKCVDAIGNGISGSFTGTKFVGATFKGNDFNCDPFFKSPQRAVDGHGKWQPLALSVAVDAFNMKGLVDGGGNTYKNCLQTIRANFEVAQSGTDVVYANPVSTGYNVDNIGIGFIPQGNFHFIIWDGDPTSATYDKNLNDNFTYNTSIPTTGTWVKGVFVTDVSGAACAAGKVSRGWSRITTGAGNVSGTDWLPVTDNC